MQIIDKQLLLRKYRNAEMQDKPKIKYFCLLIETTTQKHHSANQETFSHLRGSLLSPT